MPNHSIQAWSFNIIYIRIHIRIHMCIYIYIYVCVCVYNTLYIFILYMHPYCLFVSRTDRVAFSIELLCRSWRGPQSLVTGRVSRVPQRNICGRENCEKNSRSTKQELNDDDWHHKARECEHITWLCTEMGHSSFKTNRHKTSLNRLNHVETPGFCIQPDALQSTKMQLIHRMDLNDSSLWPSKQPSWFVSTAASFSLPLLQGCAPYQV